ncbi:MAG: alpha/beta hydrolase family protein [Candidatus Thorarchaeota archaeon]|jgi:predicted dienelactone hydrolase
MQILEIVLLVLLFILSIQWFLPSVLSGIEKRTLMGLMTIASVILTLVVGILYGFRWQLLPIYLPVLIFIIYELFQQRNMLKSKVEVSTAQIQGTRKKFGAAIVIIMLVLMATSVVLDSMLPMFVLPEPTGEYNVGTINFELTDTSRNETFTADPDDYRRFLIQAWYPTDDVTGLAPIPYIEYPTEFGTAVENSFGFPPIIVSHFPLVKTHSYRDAPLSDAESEFPVLLFSHGYGGFVYQNTILMEELASQGYVIFSISHTYESAATVFPNGDVAYEANPEDYSNIASSLDIWAADSMYLLDQLEIVANDNIPQEFWTHLDLDTIGAFGHSFGGTTAEELCIIDPRVDAGISFDSPHGGNSLDINMTKPLMMIFGPDYGNPEMNDTIFQRAENTCYGLFVNGTRHYNFADVVIWSSLLKSFGLLGSIDGNHMLDIMRDYVLAFFDQELRGIDSTLLNGPSADYPEVLFYYNNL